jgi:hypothetical protein
LDANNLFKENYEILARLHAAVNNPRVQYACYKFLLEKAKEAFNSTKVPLAKMKLQ